jgi:hypothetical protein
MVKAFWKKGFFTIFPAFPPAFPGDPPLPAPGPVIGPFMEKAVSVLKNQSAGRGNDAGRNRFRFGLGSLFTILYLLSSENSSLIVPSGMPAASAGKDFPRCAAYMVHNGDFPERRRDG